METAIYVIWWIGLVVALGITLLILKEVISILRELKGIVRLTNDTIEAAEGLSRNLSNVPKLAELGTSTDELQHSVDALVSALDSMERAVNRIPG